MHVIDNINAYKNRALIFPATVNVNTNDLLIKVHLLVDKLEYLKKNDYFKDDKKGCLDV